MRGKLGLAVLSVIATALVSTGGLYQANAKNALKGVELTKLNVQAWVKGSGIKPGTVTWPGVKVEWRYAKTSGYARLFNIKPIPYADLAPPNIVEPGWPFQVNRCTYERIQVEMELRGSGVRTIPAPVVLDGGKLVKSDPRPSGWEGNVPVYTVDLRGGKTPKITYVMEYSGSAGGGGAASSAPSSAGVSSAPPAGVSSAAGAGSVASAKGGSVASASPGSVAGSSAAGAGYSAPTGSSSAVKTARTGVLGAGTYKTGVSIFAVGAAAMAALLGGYLLYRGVG